MRRSATTARVLGMAAIAILAGAVLLMGGDTRAGGNGCPWDFDGNLLVDNADIISLLTVWGPCPGCPQDLDGNGVVDGHDLGDLLVNCGPC